MQKVQSYLYPNRIILLADLAGFTVENKVPYTRTVKIYRGIDNVIEFDIQNSDQKRIDLTTLSNLKVNIMDMGGQALVSSPYSLTALNSATASNATVTATSGKQTTTTITIPTSNISGTFLTSCTVTGTSISGPVLVSGVTSDVDSATTTITVTFPSQTVATASGLSIACVPKGLAKITIPLGDISQLDNQFLKYSVTAVDQLGNHILLYADSNFGGVGTMEIIGNATPSYRNSIIYDEFVGEINFMGNVINHTPAIPCRFYEANQLQLMNFQVSITNFIGTIYVEATEDMTISTSSFLNSPQLQSFSCTTPTTDTISLYNCPVLNSITNKKYNYMRISWMYPDVWQYGSQQNPQLQFGLVNNVTVLYFY